MRKSMRFWARRLAGATLWWLGAPIRAVIRRQLVHVMLNDPIVVGNPRRFHMSPKARKNNILVNTNGGHVHVGDYVLFGKSVCLITGTHDYAKFNWDRMYVAPSGGRDIVIEEGVWLATNALVIGPCRIGKHSVVAAGSVVTRDVPPFTVVAGVPAKPIRQIRERPKSDPGSSCPPSCSA